MAKARSDIGLVGLAVMGQQGGARSLRGIGGDVTGDFSRLLGATRRATLATGRMPSLHGVRINGISLSLAANTFIDMLRLNGWRTALMIGSSWSSPGSTRSSSRCPSCSPSSSTPSWPSSGCSASSRWAARWSSRWPGSSVSPG